MRDRTARVNRKCPVRVRTRDADRCDRLEHARRPSPAVRRSGERWGMVGMRGWREQATRCAVSLHALRCASRLSLRTAHARGGDVGAAARATNSASRCLHQCQAAQMSVDVPSNVAAATPNARRASDKRRWMGVRAETLHVQVW